ncbi:RHS repeat-associated core domain-containing protein, partial [bacterium]|nr:RHS repeat-associated core domain-containing protein [bacterium]
YYDPALGRFLQQDPEGYSDSPNLYQAFLNNPVNYTDPMGTEAIPGRESKQIQCKTGVLSPDSPDCVGLEAHFSDTSECSVGRTPGQAYSCIVNSLPGSVSDAEKKSIALQVVGHNYPNIEQPSQQDLAVTKGALLAERPVELMGEGLAIFFTTVAPGTIIAELAPAATLGLEAEGLLRPPVRVPRPAWRKSELDVGELLESVGYESEPSFLNGQRVPRNTSGSTRPDFANPEWSVDVKNYSIDTSAHRADTVYKISKQVQHRGQHLPAQMKQRLILDIRGQNIPDGTVQKVIQRLSKKTGIPAERIEILK